MNVLAATFISLFFYGISFSQPIKIIECSESVIYPGVEMEGNPANYTWQVTVSLKSKNLIIDSVSFSGFTFSCRNYKPGSENNIKITLSTTVFNDATFLMKMYNMQAVLKIQRKNSETTSLPCFVSSIATGGELPFAVILYYTLNKTHHSVFSKNFNRRNIEAAP